MTKPSNSYIFFFYPSTTSFLVWIICLSLMCGSEMLTQCSLIGQSSTLTIKEYNTTICFYLTSSKAFLYGFVALLPYLSDLNV